MDLELQGKRVLVLGGSKGFGFAIAKAFAEEGAQVAVCSRSKVSIEEAASKLGGAKGFTVDFSEKNSGKIAGEKARELLGGIDVLVTNGGNPKMGHFQDLTSEDWMGGFQSTWMSAAESIHSVIPQMKEQKWGRILMLTSFSAKEPYPILTLSNALRAGLLGLMKTLSNEMAPFGITVNALLPGFTKTEALKALNVPDETFLKDVRMKRLGEPYELASLCAYLASQKAGYITGQAIAVDGGMMKSF